MGNILERQARASSGRADTLRMFIQPQHHDELRRLMDSMGSVFAASGLGSFGAEEREGEHEDVLLNIAAGEMWASLRAQIRAMEKLMADEEHKAASLVFWEYLSEISGHVLVMQYLKKHGSQDIHIRGKSAIEDPVGAIVHALGGKMILNLLSQSFTEEGMKRRERRGKFPKFGKAAAEEQLDELRRIASRLLVPL